MLDNSLYNAVTGVLTFLSIQFGDRGLYRCEARNFLGFDSATVKIVVEGMENYFLINMDCALVVNAVKIEQFFFTE